MPLLAASRCESIRDACEPVYCCKSSVADGLVRLAVAAAVVRMRGVVEAVGIAGSVEIVGIVLVVVGVAGVALGESGKRCCTGTVVVVFAAAAAAAARAVVDREAFADVAVAAIALVVQHTQCERARRVCVRQSAVVLAAAGRVARRRRLTLSSASSRYVEY